MMILSRETIIEHVVNNSKDVYEIASAIDSIYVSTTYEVRAEGNSNIDYAMYIGDKILEWDRINSLEFIAMKRIVKLLSEMFNISEKESRKCWIINEDVSFEKTLANFIKEIGE